MSMTVSRCVFALCAAFAGIASAQSYSTRPIRVVVPQPAGGSMDANARALAYSAAKRWTGMPKLPAMAEIVPGFIYDAAWHGMFAAAATPKPIVLRLQSEIAKAIQLPKMRDFLDAGGYVPPGGTPDAFKTFLEKDLKTLAELFRLATIKSE